MEDIDTMLLGSFLFLIIFLLLQIVLLLLLHKLLFSKLHLMDISISPKNLRYILADAALCAAIFVINFAFGVTLGYPLSFIAINCLLFGIYYVY